MADSVLNFKDDTPIGKIVSVDASRVLISQTEDIVSRVGVGGLIAIKGTAQSGFFIGMIERITRAPQNDIVSEDMSELFEDEISICASVADSIIRALLIGNYKADSFNRGLDSFPLIDQKCYSVEGENLQRFLELQGSGLSDKERLEVGHFAMDERAAAIVNGDKFFQRHASILGSTGSGKSWAVALILEKASKLSFPNIIVLDLHGEYGPLAEGKNAFAKRFRVAGPGDLDAPSKDNIFLPYWLLTREEMLSILLDRGDSNAPNQASLFTRYVRELKDLKLETLGKDDTRKTFTVDSPIPYELSRLLEKLEAEDCAMVPGAREGSMKKGELNGKLTNFIARLTAKVQDRRYGFLFSPPRISLNYDWLSNLIQQLLCSGKNDKGVKIIDFSDVPFEVLPVVVGVFARVLYNIQTWLEPKKRTPFTVVCDEAHLYLPVEDSVNVAKRQALHSFERIAKEGRKYGVSLLVVSQRPSEVSRTILSQCNNFLVLRLTNIQDQLFVKRLVPDSMAGVTDVLPLLEIGEAMLLGDAILLPTRIKLDPPSIEPASATLNFWSDWGTKQPDASAIVEAVESSRRQTRFSSGKNKK